MDNWVLNVSSIYQLTILCEISDHDIDTSTANKSLKMKFLYEKIYCNSSPNDTTLQNPRP